MIILEVNNILFQLVKTPAIPVGVFFIAGGAIFKASRMRNETFLSGKSTKRNKRCYTSKNTTVSVGHP